MAPPYLSQEIYDGDPQSGEMLRHDVFGRLVSVNENRASSGTGACQGETTTGFVTTYDYDKADRLTEVCSTGGTAGCSAFRGGGGRIRSRRCYHHAPGRPTPPTSQIHRRPPDFPYPRTEP